MERENVGKRFLEITPELQSFIEEQSLFFVGIAPLSANGHVNVSPKGLDTFRALGPRWVSYLDLTGSGNETAAHVMENERLTTMFCAFSGPPKIVRLYCRARVVARGMNGYVRTDLLRRQAESFGLPFQLICLPFPCGNKV